MKIVSKFQGAGLALLVSALVAGCYVDARKKDDGAAAPPVFGGNGAMMPAPAGPPADCAVASYAWVNTGSDLTPHATMFCYEQGRQTWLTSCKDGACRKLQVNVHYMLTEDLGADRVVVVEAFDNAGFQGAPVGTGILSGFEADKPGRHGAVSLLLEPNAYYLRAYVAKANDTPKPYTYGDLQLVVDVPVGLYGAASGAVQVDLRERDADTVDIYLDQLFKSPGAGPGTQAHLRFGLQIADGVTIDTGRLVKVQLFSSDDFAFEPVYSFDVATERFLVEGHRGSAELVTPELTLGRYYLRAFLDASGNGYWDANEATATFMAGGIKGVVETQAKRTDAVPLTLAAPQP